MRVFSDTGRLVGHLRGNIYRKVVKKSKHLFRLFDAWGVDTSIVNQLSTEGCTEIRIKDSESGIVYSISLVDFMEHSVEREFGHSKQRFVSRKYFTAKENGTEKNVQ